MEKKKEKEGKRKKKEEKIKKKGEKKQKKRKKEEEREYNSRKPLRKFNKIRAFYIDIFQKNSPQEF